jgi:hypothetical protein
MLQRNFPKIYLVLSIDKILCKKDHVKILIIYGYDLNLRKIFQAQ